MSYKVCSRCQFIVLQQDAVCTTCGSNSFSTVEDGDAGQSLRAIVKPITGRRTTATHYLPTIKTAQLAGFSAPNSLRRKMREYAAMRSGNRLS